MKTIKGDLIKLAEQGKFDIIIQGCNCFHKMRSGLAKQLADRYPIVKETDRQSKFGDIEKLGKWTEVIVNDTFTVVNAYTQYRWSSSSDVFEYEAFQQFLKVFAESVLYCPSRINIGFPQIGAGLAGGDWSRISKMIEKFSEDVSDYADVTVVEYQP
jgi:O-acetyl-ADP-ribose deacetylase (regulator of RNase III)